MNSERTNHFDVLIVGAGISGLMAANELQNAGARVLVVDKGKGVGGRMATWRMGNGRADYGAQFFTVREPEFQHYVNKWLDQGILFEWSRGWSDGSQLIEVDDGHPRYAAYEGMSQIAKHLAQSLTVYKATRVTAVHLNKDQWQVTTENDQTYLAQSLILTAPVPQSLALLDAGHVPLDPADRQALEEITYAPCISGLFWIEGDVNLPDPGALQLQNGRIGWIANNQQKGISPKAVTVTLHINPIISQLWYKASKEELKGGLTRELMPHLPAKTTVKEVRIHKWKYALPTNIFPERILTAKNLPALIFAGDAFNGPRVEGAALSGLAASKAIHI